MRDELAKNRDDAVDEDDSHHDSLGAAVMMGDTLLMCP